MDRVRGVKRRRDGNDYDISDGSHVRSISRRPHAPCRKRLVVGTLPERRGDVLVDVAGAYVVSSIDAETCDPGADVAYAEDSECPVFHRHVTSRSCPCLMAPSNNNVGSREGHLTSGASQPLLTSNPCRR
jgi:hypothetical protein